MKKLLSIILLFMIAMLSGCDDTPDNAPVFEGDIIYEFDSDNYYTKEEVDKLISEIDDKYANDFDEFLNDLIIAVEEYNYELEQRIEELESIEYTYNVTPEQYDLLVQMLYDVIDDELTQDDLANIIDNVLDDNGFYEEYDMYVEDYIQYYFEQMLIVIFEDLEQQTIGE